MKAAMPKKSKPVSLQHTVDKVVTNYLQATDPFGDVLAVLSREESDAMEAAVLRTFPKESRAELMTDHEVKYSTDLISNALPRELAELSARMEHNAESRSLAREMVWFHLGLALWRRTAKGA